MNTLLDRRTTRSMLLASAASCLVGGLLLGGCAPVQKTTWVNVANDSSIPVRVHVWPSAEAAPAEEGQLVPSGGQFDFGFPPESAGGSTLTVSAEPASGTMPMQALELVPPGPHFVAVRGNEVGISVNETTPPAGIDRSIPRDPRQQGRHDDIPPVNPSF